jgi:hypothetical protein
MRGLRLSTARVKPLLLAVGLAAALFGHGGPASANATTGAMSSVPPGTPVHLVGVRPGSVWTFRLNSGACEVDSFHAHTFTADRLGDSGTYKTDKVALTMTWTSGGNGGTAFKGTFSRSAGRYSGRWLVYRDRIPATLTPGASC